MTRFGYTLLTEQSGPRDLVRYAVSAEERGFLFGGRLVNWRGDYFQFQVDSARLWDLPGVPVGITVAMAGTKAVEKFANLADHLVEASKGQG